MKALNEQYNHCAEHNYCVITLKKIFFKYVDIHTFPLFITQVYPSLQQQTNKNKQKSPHMGIIRKM